MPSRYLATPYLSSNTKRSLIRRGVRRDIVIFNALDAVCTLASKVPRFGMNEMVF